MSLNPETVKSVIEQQDELVERSVQEISIETLYQLASYLEMSAIELSKLARIIEDRARLNLKLVREVKEFLSTVSE